LQATRRVLTMPFAVYNEHYVMVTRVAVIATYNETDTQMSDTKATHTEWGALFGHIPFVTCYNTTA